MEVRYENTKEDYLRATRYFPLGKRLWWAYGPLSVALIASCLPPTLLLIFFQRPLGLAGGYTLIALIIGLAAWRVARTSRDISGTYLRPIRLQLTPDYLEAETELAWSRRDWSYFTDVKDKENYILLILGEIEFFIIPKHAFASTDEATRFAKTAAAFIEAGKSSNGIFAHDKPPRFDAEDGSDSAAVWQVQFKNSPGDLAEVYMHGVKKPNQQQSSPLSVWISMLIVFGMAVVVLVLSADASRLGRELTGFGALVVSFVCLLALSTTLSRLTVQARFARNYRIFQEQKLAISPAGVASQSKLWIGRSLWQSFDGVEQDERFLVIYQARPNIAHIIPKSIFDTPEEASRFGNLAIEYHERAGGAEPQPGEPPPVETGNPYQSPRL